MTFAIDSARLLGRLQQLGATGRDEAGRLCRIAASDADKAGRDLLCNWLRQAGLRVEIDRIGNIHGIWEPEGASGNPVVMGSHIDTVIDAGIYDGCYQSQPCRIYCRQRSDRGGKCPAGCCKETEPVAGPVCVRGIPQNSGTIFTAAMKLARRKDAPPYRGRNAEGGSMDQATLSPAAVVGCDMQDAALHVL